jgi:creatinine amidohydrolase
MNRRRILLMMLSGIALTATVHAQTTVKDLAFHHLQEYSWIRLATLVPEVTDRVILPMGTVESHGAVPIGADNIIPMNLTEQMYAKCNALVAPVINHGVTGLSVSQYPGSITVRPEVFEEYLYDVLKGLVRTGFKNILIVNGHGGNTEPAKLAMNRIHQESAVHIMMVEWWKVAFNVVNEVYGAKAQQSGHGDLEEAALVMSSNPKLIDREMYEKLGKDNVGRAGTDEGFYMVPAWATTRYPEAGTGYLDFDVAKAKLYTEKKADYIATIFLEAVKRWEMMEGWKR